MPVLRKEFLDIQATIEYRFTLKRVCDITKTYSEMHLTDKYSQHSTVIWLIWLNGWVLVYELSGCGFESHYSHLNFRFWACLKQKVQSYQKNQALLWIRKIYYTLTNLVIKNNYSTDLCFFYLNNRILKSFDNGLMTCMILIDFQKAFEIIHQDIDQATGFSKHTVNWFQSYLSNRSFWSIWEIIFLNLHLYPAVYLKVLFWGHSCF